MAAWCWVCQVFLALHVTHTYYINWGGISMQAKPLQIHTRSTQAPAVRHGARVNACCPPFTHPRLHVSHAEPLGPHSNQPAASDRAARLCCNVASKDLKSDAELFIESVVQESQRAQQDAAPANGLQASLEQLQQRVAAGRSKVRAMQCHGA